MKNICARQTVFRTIKIYIANNYKNLCNLCIANNYKNLCILNAVEDAMDYEIPVQGRFMLPWACDSDRRRESLCQVY